MKPAEDISAAAIRGGEYDDGVRYDAQYGGIDDDGQFFLDLARQCGPRILDLGCGTGRLAIPLCRAGKRVTGLDAMTTMLGHAQRKAGDLPIRWVSGDFRDFALGETYDLAISCAHAFQSLLTEDDQQRFLACVARHLEAGATLAFDTRNPSRVHLDVPPEEMPWHSYANPAGEVIDASGSQRYNPTNGLMHYVTFQIGGQAYARPPISPSSSRRWSSCVSC